MAANSMSLTPPDAQSDGIYGSIDSEDKGLCFTLFPKLPPEIRRIIWKEACFVPRIIDLWTENLPDPSNSIASGQNDNWSPSTHACRFCDPPAILYASSESRSVGLEHYSLEFGTTMERQEGGSTITVVIPPRIYINWDWDIICPLRWRLNKLFLSDMATMKSIKRIALLTSGRLTDYLIDNFLKHSDLTEIILYVPKLGWMKELNVKGPAAFSFTNIQDTTDEQLESHRPSTKKVLLDAKFFLTILMKDHYKLPTLKLALLTIKGRMEE